MRSAQSLDLRELWELLQDEDTATFSWQELAAFVVSGDDRLAMAGVLDALWNEGVYFKEKQLGEFVLRDAKSVEELLHQQAVERQRLRAQSEFVAWVQAAQTQADSLPGRTAASVSSPCSQGWPCTASSTTKSPRLSNSWPRPAFGPRAIPGMWPSSSWSPSASGTPRKN